MSTPSTATAPMPPHHHHGHQYHASYASNSSHHSPSDLTRLGQTYTQLASPARNPPTSQTSRAAAAPAAPPSSSSSNNTSNTTKMSQAQNQKQPDWREFYKNGVPSEIIVIDDDTPPPVPHHRQQPQTTQNGVPAEHSSKRRRTLNGVNPAGGAPTYSETNTPQYGGSGSATVSADRTASMQHTTAATSLGSHASSGSASYADNATVGQKRKRVTRQDTAADKKRREVAAPSDPFSSYVPPPRPAKKAKDVHVPLIRETTVSQQRVDDDDGHYIVTEDTQLANRYHILKLLGQGTFGKVIEAYDRQKKEKVAIKIIRSVQKYRDASKIELRVLSTLAMNDKENRNKCIHFRECFDYRSHICIVTDLLGQSVFDFLKANSFVPFPSSQIQNFARQLLTSVAFLHDLNLIHTDLKPENVLLVSNAYQTFTYNKNIPSSSNQTQRTARQRKVLLDTDIRLIDFGSATFEEEYHSSVVSTRHYRAPEIILSLGWSFPCDIWSIGCILVEFFTGDALFQTHDNLEHLAMMEMVMKQKVDTKLVKQVLQKGSSSAKFFKKNYTLDYPTKDTTKASRTYVKAMKALEDIIPAHSNFNKQFLDLLRKIFVYDPSSRITAKQALKHPWFRESLVDDGTEAARIKRERAANRAVNGYR